MSKPSLPSETTWAEIDLSAIAENFFALSALEPRLDCWPVIKADAYGHGEIEVARRLIEAAWQAGSGTGKQPPLRLCVARVEEAVRLRQAGCSPTQARLLVFAPPTPETAAAYSAHQLEAAVGHEEHWRMLEAAGGDNIVSVHIKFDTGMGRLGYAPHALPQALESALAAAKGGAVQVAGVYTHFACADNGQLEPTRQQLELFAPIAAAIKGHWPDAVAHAANSAGLLDAAAECAREAGLVAARPGIALYGIAPSAEIRNGAAVARLRPAMALYTRVVHVKHVATGTPISYGHTVRVARPTVVATLAVGYADGYPRSLSNSGCVLLGAHRAPILGRVCMDLIMVDATDATARNGGRAPAIGDVATLIGSGLAANAVAEAAGTIGYELLTRIGPRVPRLYRS